MASTIKVDTIDTPDGTGNITVSRPLSGSGASLTAVGIYESVAVIVDRKAHNVNAGTFTSGAWRTRDLNTEISDADGIVSISTNQFTLQAGTYTIYWSGECQESNGNGTRLYNVTDTSAVNYGTCAYAEASSSGATQSSGWTVITISGAKAFEIQHRCQTTRADYGLGIACSLDASGYSIYTVVKILKHR